MSSHIDAKEAEPGSGVRFDHKADNGFDLKIIDKERAIVEGTPKRDKVAIVGFATSSRDLAPFDDPSYEIWTLNQIYRHVPRCSRHFDIHSYWEEDNVEGTDHRGWIRDCPRPVYMHDTEKDLPNSVRYPIEKVIEMAGIDYFTSTVAFEVGLAMLEGFKTIGLYGIDLIVGTEYAEQKACLEFWLGLAHGKGIEVIIPGQSALLKQSHRYGYEREPDFGPLKISEVSNRIDHLSTERNRKMALINALDGALAENERKVRQIDELTPKERMNVLQEQRGEALATIATIDGAVQEATYWRDLFTLRGRGAVVNSNM
jgi:hypothetical protein|tara:strand:- start:28373 stop:29317 length:945 start_codon:yes stop_codon:yes gene_type:complete